MRSGVVASVLALVVAAASTAATAEPRAAGGNKVSSEVDADAAFARGLESLRQWCGVVERAHDAHDDDAIVIVRLARCQRFFGKLEEATTLLSRSEAHLGRPAILQAMGASAPCLAAAGSAPVAKEGHARREVCAAYPTWERACEEFKQSLVLEPSATTQIAVGACQFEAGKWSAAKVLFRAAIDSVSTLAAAGDHFRQSQLALATAFDREIDALRPRYTLRASDGFSGSITLDGTPLAPNVAQHVEPGRHQIVTRFPDGRAEQRSLDASAAQSFDITVRRERYRSSTRRIATWSLAAGALVSSAIASAYFVKASRTWDKMESVCTRSSLWLRDFSCPSEIINASDDPERYDNQSLVFQLSTASAMVLVGGALAVYFTAPTPHRLTVSPTATDRSLGVVVGAGF
jgi:hypothetical protein